MYKYWYLHSAEHSAICMIVKAYLKYFFSNASSDYLITKRLDWPVFHEVVVPLVVHTQALWVEAAFMDTHIIQARLEPAPSPLTGEVALSQGKVCNKQQR